MFRNRSDAGRLLGTALSPFRGSDTIVLAIPGGGVPVGKEVATMLGADLDVVVTRKIGAPGNPEFAIGSVTQDGRTVADMALVKELHVSADYLSSEAERQFGKIRKSLEKYRGEKPYPKLEGKTVIITDDGIATGSTMMAAIESVRGMHPYKLVVAIPVAPHDAIRKLSGKVDKVVCLVTPFTFYAVGDYYSEFEHVGEERVKELLARPPATHAAG